MPDKILVIEDDAALRNELAGVLTGADFAVMEAANCLDALVLLEKDNPDLVILDENIPLIDGWETSQLLRRAYGLPVIVIGEDNSADAWIRVIEAGAEFYLRMPCSRLELTSRARAILRRYQPGKVVFHR
ncbi:MAG: response regulator [Chloroflexota bacterium]